MNSVIAIASDHAGFELKLFLKAELEKQNLTVLDLALDIDAESFYGLDNLLGFVSVEAFFNVDLLTCVPQRRNSRFFSFDVAQIDVALRKLPNHDLYQRF